VDVIPVQEPQPGSPAALLEVWGSDVPDEAWDAVEKAIEELDRTDREHIEYVIGEDRQFD
jgi:hypothetical protein